MRLRATVFALPMLLLSCGHGGSGSDDASGDGADGDGGDTGDDGGATESEGDGATGGTSGGDGGTDSSGDGGDDGDPEPTPPQFQVCDGAAPGQTIMADPSNYRTLLGTMQPGDTLSLSAGTYADGLPITDMNGSEGNCFVIEGPASGDRAVFTGSSSRNTVAIRDSSFVVIRNLELDGMGELGDGVKGEGNAAYAHHITLENLDIHGHGVNQQVVGISTKCPAWNWVIRRNRVVGAGTGLYLGNSDGNQPFVDGLIEHNVVLDTVGYNMQIKHQNPRPNLAGLPASGTTIIRHNVFSKANGASTGGDARPNLLLGHLPLSGDGQDDLYVVYGNFFYENPVERLIQAEGNVALHNNIIVTSTGSAVGFQPHNDVPRSISAYFNTIIALGTGISVTGADTGYEQVVVGNAVFAGTPLSGGMQADNHTGSVADAATFLAAPASDPGDGLDLHPLADALADGADVAGLTAIVGSLRDFDGRMRDGTFRGAYAGPAEAGAWAVELDEKP